MKEAQPFNPMPLPSDFTLPLEVGTFKGPAVAPNTAAPLRVQSQIRNKAKRLKRTRPAASRLKPDRYSRWKKVKGQIRARLALLDRARLKQVLLGCGVAAAVVLAVLLAPQRTPIAVLLLALLGLAAVMRLWARLRSQPIPG